MRIRIGMGIRVRTRVGMRMRVVFEPHLHIEIVEPFAMRAAARELGKRADRGAPDAGVVVLERRRQRGNRALVADLGRAP